MAGLLGSWLGPEAALGMAPLPDVIGAATPFFFLLIAVEMGAAAIMNRKVYNLRQLVNNLSAGVLTVLLGLFLKALHVFPYQAIHERWGWQLGSKGHAFWLHAACFMLCDLAFYWFHRTCHATNLGWSAHVVHHSSPDFNLGTALRQGAGEASFSWLFNLPLALFCPLPIFALHKGVNTVYQFFTHTELVGKLWRPLELVLNTPSHHRVHHARNYGRRNFAGLLIVWDRLFGTFEEEDEGRRCVYGLDGRARPLGTYNPLWHQLQHLLATLRLAATQGPLLATLFTRKYGAGMVRLSVTDAEPPAGEGKRGPAAAMGPAAAPAGAAASGEQQGAAGTAAGPFPWDPRPLGLLDFNAAAHFFSAAIPGGLWALAGPGQQRDAGATTAGAAWSALTVVSLGRLLDGTTGAVLFELVRLVVQFGGAKYALSQGLLPVGGLQQVARAACALSAASALVLLGQLLRMGPGAAAAGHVKKKRA